MNETEKINAPRIECIVSRVKGKILDVGCVGGDHLLHSARSLSLLHQRIKRKCQNVIGLDLNIKGLRQLKRVDPETSLVCADACYLPFRNKSINTLVAGELIEHLSNVGFFLDEVHRVLTQNGILLGDTPNAWNLKFVIDLLRRKRQSITQNTAHIHVFDKYSLELLLLQHGFHAEIFYIRIEARQHIWNFLKILEKTIYPTTTHWLGFKATKISKQRAKTLLLIWFEKISRTKGLLIKSNNRTKEGAIK